MSAAPMSAGALPVARILPAPKHGPVLVVGAGISGLSAALRLARLGHEVEVWESAARPGGLLAPIRFRGVDVDLGSHRVHADAHPAFFDLTGPAMWQERPRRGSLILGERRIPYPLRPWSFVRALGIGAALGMAAQLLTSRVARQAVAHWEQERRRPPEYDEGFERFVCDRVGVATYQRFYRPYAEKVWGVGAATLSRSVAKQRTSMRAPVRAVAEDLLSRRRPPTFLYPQLGMASIIHTLVSELEALGVRIRLGRRADLDALRGSDFAHILHSGRLADLVPSCGLAHRGLYVLHLALPPGCAGPEDTFYAPEPEYWFGRVSRPDRFSPHLGRAGETTLCVEIPEGRWGPHRDFRSDVDRIIAQLCRAGILVRPVDVVDVCQTYRRHVYPLYHRGWYGRWQSSLSRLAEADARILPMGRQGLFLHCNLDHCVRIAMDAVEHVRSGGGATGWRSRAESYLGLRVRD